MMLTGLTCPTVGAVITAQPRTVKIAFNGMPPPFGEEYTIEILFGLERVLIGCRQTVA
jgi:hypothetical protein